MNDRPKTSLNCFLLVVSQFISQNRKSAHTHAAVLGFMMDGAGEDAPALGKAHGGFD